MTQAANPQAERAYLTSTGSIHFRCPDLQGSGREGSGQIARRLTTERGHRKCNNVSGLFVHQGLLGSGIPVIEDPTPGSPCILVLGEKPLTANSLEDMVLTKAIQTCYSAFFSGKYKLGLLNILEGPVCSFFSPVLMSSKKFPTAF